MSIFLGVAQTLVQPPGIYSCPLYVMTLPLSISCISAFCTVNRGWCVEISTSTPPILIYRILLIGVETWWWPFLVETCSFTNRLNIFITKLCCLTTLTTLITTNRKLCPHLMNGWMWGGSSYLISPKKKLGRKIFNLSPLRVKVKTWGYPCPCHKGI